MILLEESCVIEDSSLLFYRDDQASTVSISSQQSFATDEGYSSDEKQHRISWIEAGDQTEPTEETQQQRTKQSTPDREIPILKSTRTIRITYTPTTYTLTFSIIILSLHYLLTQSPTLGALTFSAVFTYLHIIFHLTHLGAHLSEHLALERHCIVYGTWLCWTGWLLGIFVFHQPLSRHTTTFLFWCLMLERRNAWGILVWEYVGRLDQNLISSDQGLKWWQIGSIRLLAFRIWCLLGTGSFWGLLYLILAKETSLSYLIQFRHLFQLLLVSVAGGLMMIIFWSFWTFQYRGILWHHESRKGVVVWYSEGLAFAGDIE